MKIKKKWLVALGLSFALSLTACSGDAAIPEDNQSDHEENSFEESVDVTKYQEIAESAMAKITEWPGPDSGPSAQSNVKIMWVSGGLASEGFKAPADASEEAAKVLGWDLKVVDGQFDPRVYNRSIQEAVDQGYDAVVLNGISVEAVSEAVKRAREAGLIVGSWDGGNSTAPDGVSFEVEYQIYEQGVALANYLIWKTNGNTNAYLVEAPEYKVIMEWVGGARDTFEECATCSVLRTDQFTALDIGTKLPSTITSSLRSNPDINVMVAGYDAAIIDAVPGIRSAGFDSLLVGSFNAIQPMSQFIRDGKAQASVAVPFAWGAWATLDNVNRLLAGEQVADQGIPFRLIATENVDEIKPDTNWNGDIDFVSHFTEIWVGE